MMPREGFILFICALCAPLLCRSATNAPVRANEDRFLVRFEWANDILTGTDNGFTAGWGISWHSRAMESWDDASRISGWIARTVPGLDADPVNGRKAKTGYGIYQTIQTPTDLSNPNLMPYDVPYAGVLGVYASWASLNNEKLRAFQTYAGILGPASRAEEVQKFIHNDLGMGTDPRGWDNQLYNEPLLNLNYEIKRKLWSYGSFGPRRFMTDIALGGGGGVGNLYTGLTGQAEWRLGWGLPRGFTPLLQGDGRGIGMNPVIDVPHDKWSCYFSLTPRVSVIGYTVLYESNTFRDHPHPGVDYDRYPVAINYGLHVSKKRFSAHFTAVYHPSNLVDNKLDTDTSFGNLTVEYLF